MASATIHPSAVIDPRAEIGEDVLIGPFCVIAGPVVLGDRCRLKSHVVISGPTTIAADNVFFPFSSIGEQSQDLKYRGEPTYLRIGEANTFRENVTVHRSTTPEQATVIGSYGNFLAYTHIAHDCVVGDHVIFSNNATLAGHVIAEDYLILGGLTAVHQFCRLGAHSITGGCSKIVQDLPPFMIADGNPAEIRGINKVGLERRDTPPETLRALRDAYKILYRENLNTQQAVAKLREAFVANAAVCRLIAFIEASERGIIR